MDYSLSGSTKDFAHSKELIDNADNIVVIPHHNADGDAVGSALGIANVLLNYGKKVTVICPNRYPDNLMWMKGSDDVLWAEDNVKLSAEIIKNCNLIIMTDFNGLGRIGMLEEIVAKSDTAKILIDHHPFPEDIADVVFSDTSVSSTAELIYLFVKGTGLYAYLDKNVAECLYTGILTDTGSFSFNSSDPRTFLITAELMTFGINKDEIFSLVFDNYSSQRLRLLGYALNSKMVIIPEFQTGYISLTAEELESFGHIPGDTEGFVNFPLSIKGIIFSAIFIEKADHIKLSFRSKRSFPANKVMSENFMGGGHLNAAGGKYNLSLDQTIERFINILPTYASELYNDN